MEEDNLDNPAGGRSIASSQVITMITGGGGGEQGGGGGGEAEGVFFSVPFIVYLLHTQRTDSEDIFRRVKKNCGKRERETERER